MRADGGAGIVNPGLTERNVRLRLEAVARQAVRSPAIDAVVLFGSRARGDCRPDSDWDVALLARSDCEHPDVIAAGKRIEAVDRYSEFQVWARTTGYLQANADKSNLLAGAVAIQGVPLAGKWPLTSAGLEGRQTMDLESMPGQQARVCEFIVGGWVAVGLKVNAAAPDTAGISYFSCMSAELLAKDIISSHSVQPDHSHDVRGLARQLERLPLEDWESAEQRLNDVETLRKMNGHAAKLHLGVYRDGPPAAESMEKCMERLLLAMELQVSWLARCAGRGADWNRAVRDAAEKIAEVAGSLRNVRTASGQRLFDALPDQTVRRITAWEARSRRLM